MDKQPDFDAVVIGAGLTGLYMAYRLRELGYSVRGIEASDDIGGVWHQNRYPGARIDSESEVYGYFWNEELMQEFNWSERFAAQPEVLKYIHRANDYMDIRKDYMFNARVGGAAFDEDSGLWTITFQDGGKAPLTARFVFSALGPLSAPQMPNVPGVHTFTGTSLHTAQWPRDPDGLGPAKLDLKGKRIAVIGTGSSGVQVIQEMAKIAGELTVFLRSPNWCTPLGNGPMSAERMAAIKADYGSFIDKCDRSIAGFPHEFIERDIFDVPKEERDAKLEELYNGPGFSLWLGAYQDVLMTPEANKYVSDFVAEKIRQRVKDPAVAEKLIPKDHGFGMKRVPLETRYYEVYNQDNVSIVDLNETPITRIEPEGIRTGEALHEFDVIIYATGFDAIKGSWNRIDVRGKGGLKLKDEWDKGVKTYLGLQCGGFPNFFTLVGPQNPATFCNIPRCSAVVVDWLSEMMEHARAEGIRRIEPESAAIDSWTGYCDKLMSRMLLGQTNSWFTGINKNIEGRDKRETLLFVGGNPKFRQYSEDVRDNGYRGFQFS
ncbi:NAD(P)/FAD-dependent oxidoreductase [Oceanicola sp. 502str15]|uniref:flavin-containing monooxygenase n=1 Tax=Oceanicola sp. 502str15 TaxID=2696061 RepID=UPI002094291C|nr:NAD(P)/FAD-dependent oxidoreductase [Oceanicola sp. 502str15]MCO6381740.1 FAD-dependent oxidoreductase [Oceanicola sp. 502str15]